MCSTMRTVKMEDVGGDGGEEQEEEEEAQLSGLVSNFFFLTVAQLTLSPRLKQHGVPNAA